MVVSRDLVVTLAWFLLLWAAIVLSKEEAVASAFSVVPRTSVVVMRPPYSTDSNKHHHHHHHHHHRRGHPQQSLSKTCLVGKRSIVEDLDNNNDEEEGNDGGEEDHDEYNESSSTRYPNLPPSYYEELLEVMWEEQGWVPTILPEKLQNYPPRSLQCMSFSVVGSNGDDNDVFCPLDVYIIGTCHVLEESANDVRLLLDSTQPDIVFVELCQERYVPLLEEYLEAPDPFGRMNATSTSSGDDNNNSNKQKQKQPFSRLEQWALKSVQEIVDDRANEFGSKQGKEFLSALQYWNETHSTAAAATEERGVIAAASEESGGNTNDNNTSSSVWPILVLGDRPFSLTFARLMERMKKREKLKFIAALLAGPLIISGLLVLLVLALISSMFSSAGGIVVGSSSTTTSLVVVQPAVAKVATKSAQKRWRDWIGVIVSLGLGAAIMRFHPGGEAANAVPGGNNPDNVEDLKEENNKKYLKEMIKEDKQKGTNKKKDLIKSVLYDESSGSYEQFIKDNRWGSSSEEVLSVERDEYMACQLFGSCLSLPANKTPKRFKVVAIVGLAHVPGICEAFNDLMDGRRSTEELMSPLLKSKRLKDEKDKYFEDAYSPPSVRWDADFWLHHRFKTTTTTTTTTTE